MIKPEIESIAKALLINSRNEALTLTYSEHKQRPENSYKPDLPGGIVDSGETEYEAVIREIREETGIEVDRDDLEMVYSQTEFIENERKSVSKHVFIVRLKSETEVTLSWEHSAYKWVSLEELRDIEYGSFYDEAITYCLKHDLLSDAILSA